MNPNIPEKCNGCGAPLLLENLYVDDCCPCNTPRGVNFTPSRCLTCKVDNCVKPGHHLPTLFGDVARWVQPEPEPRSAWERVKKPAV